VKRLRREGLLVEATGPQRLYSRREVEYSLADPWINASQVAAILVVSRARVRQLGAGDKLPYHVTATGRRVFRARRYKWSLTRERSGGGESR
jgi:hypothetical protein